ncbi:MAG: hypothetical protein HYY62_01570 [Deltaproteobacteria bacterium]|nr:hypothetical protein [Deltaproteobacteria bacterium]
MKSKVVFIFLVLFFTLSFNSLTLHAQVKDTVTVIPYSQTVTNSWSGPNHPDALKLKAEAEQKCSEAVSDIETRLLHLSLKFWGFNPRLIKITPRVELFSGGIDRDFLGYRCSIKLESQSLDYTMLESDSEVKDQRRECYPIVDRNEKNRDVLYQELRSGWAIIGGHWCQVHLVELIQR